MYVTIAIGREGLGNLCFQVAAILGYAEQHGHTPVFVREWFTEQQEQRDHPGPCHIRDMFPTIQIVDKLLDYQILKEQPAYAPLPYCAKHVKLEGYFQSEKYFPSYRMETPLFQTKNQPKQKAIFLHVRRGDYLHPLNKHHAVDLRAYYRRALSATLEPGMSVLVCSDDIPWCKDHLPTMYGDLVQNWQWAEGTDVETLEDMSLCEYGGICANSSFSWWGGYWNTSPKKILCMPDTWGYPPFPPFQDIYPKGVYVLPVSGSVSGSS